MTRGKIMLIKNNKFAISDEFNGDMYLEGHGFQVIDGLQNVNNYEEFSKMVNNFNVENHNYSDMEINVIELREQKLDFVNNYFYYWFSDYIYIKNIGYDISFLCKDTNEETIIETLKTGQILVLNFGRVVAKGY